MSTLPDVQYLSSEVVDRPVYMPYTPIFEPYPVYSVYHIHHPIQSETTHAHRDMTLTHRSAETQGPNQTATITPTTFEDAKQRWIRLESDLANARRLDTIRLAEQMMDNPIPPLKLHLLKNMSSTLTPSQRFPINLRTVNPR